MGRKSAGKFNKPKQGRKEDKAWAKLGQLGKEAKAATTQPQPVDPSGQAASGGQAAGGTPSPAQPSSDPHSQQSSGGASCAHDHQNRRRTGPIGHRRTTNLSNMVKKNIALGTQKLEELKASTTSLETLEYSAKLSNWTQEELERHDSLKAEAAELLTAVEQLSSDSYTEVDLAQGGPGQGYEDWLDKLGLQSSRLIHVMCRASKVRVPSSDAPALVAHYALIETVEKAQTIFEGIFEAANQYVKPSCVSASCNVQKNPPSARKWTPRTRTLHPSEDLSSIGGYIWWTEEELADRFDQMHILSNLEFSYKEFQNASRANSVCIKDKKSDVFGVSKAKNLTAPSAGKPELDLLRFKLRRARESQALIPGRNTDNKLVEHCRCLYYRSLQRTRPEDWRGKKDMRPFLNPRDPLLDIYLNAHPGFPDVDGEMFVEKIELSFVPTNPLRANAKGICALDGCGRPLNDEAREKHDKPWRDAAAELQALATVAGVRFRDKTVASSMSQVIFKMVNFDQIVEALRANRMWQRSDKTIWQEAAEVSDEKLQKIRKSQPSAQELEWKQRAASKEFSAEFRKGFRKFLRDLWRSTVFEHVDNAAQNWHLLNEKQYSIDWATTPNTDQTKAACWREGNEMELPFFDIDLIDKVGIAKDLWVKLDTNDSFRNRALAGGPEWLTMTVMGMMMDQVRDRKMKALSYFLNSVKSRDEKRKILKEDKVEMEKYLKGRSKPQQQRIVENMQRAFAATTIRDKK